MKTIEDARSPRDAILAKFEMAELATDPQERAEWLTFVVIGAGPTGVELAGQIAELAHTVLPRDYRSVDTREARIILLEGAPAVLPPFAPKLQKYTQRQLEAMGVEVRTNSLAVDMDHDSVTVKGPDGLETIRARTRIWAAGVQASPLATLLAKQAGVDADRAGRLPVEPRLHPGRAPRGVRDRRHGVAEQAARGGPARAAGGQVRRQGDQGPAGRAARARAVQVLRQGHHGHHRLQGRRRRRLPRQGDRPIAYLMWLFIHVMYLVGWGNRIGTLYTWARAFLFSGGRAHRIITYENARAELPRGRTRAINPAVDAATAAGRPAKQQT